MRLAGAAGPVTSDFPTQLLERDLELGAVDALLTRALAGRGGRLLIEGPAGIGKSALLEATRERGTSLGMRCLLAEASEVGSQVAFGVTRAALGDSWRGSTLPGNQSAGPVAAVLIRGVATVLDLAEEGPVLLCIDDVQWADVASLRLLASLSRHVPGAGIILALGIRLGGHDDRSPVFRELLDDRGAIVVRPAPLSLEAATKLLASRSGRELEPGLVAWCHEQSRGNPYLLLALSDGLRLGGAPTAEDERSQLRELGARAVARSVAGRLTRLDPGERALIEAVAVAGDLGSLAHLAAVAGVDPTAAFDATQHLLDQDLLRRGDTVELTHPLIGAAIRAQLGAARRQQITDRAVQLLMANGRVERAAALLADLPARGDQGAAEMFRAAADLASRRGAPDVAAALLRRGLAEDPSPPLRPRMCVALGQALLSLGDLAAVEVFEQVVAEAPPGPELAAAATMLALALNYARRTGEAVAVLDRVRARLGSDEAAAEELDSIAMHYMSLDPSMRERWLQRLHVLGERRGASELAYRERLSHLSTERWRMRPPRREQLRWRNGRWRAARSYRGNLRLTSGRF